jgi:hypothetical protein
MRKCNLTKSDGVSIFFRLFLITVVALSLAVATMALNRQPARAAVTFNPPYPAVIHVSECQPFNTGPVTITSACTIPPCPFPPGWPPETHSFWPVSSGWPGWLNLDPNTGAFWGCPDKGAADYTATILCWSQVPNVTTCTGSCFDFAFATITFKVDVANPACMTIDPVFIPWCWEGAPFNMTCTVSGGVGPYTWSAVGLPAGLAMDAAGNITGTPSPGTCNSFNNVMVTVTDTGYCAGGLCPCPTTVNRTFILYVDCWANYTPIIFTTITTGCDQTVEIGPGLTQGQTNLLVDGSHVATLAGGQKYTISSVLCEGHTVMVDQTVQPNSNTRFAVVGANIKTFTETDNYAYFDYAPEVEIRTASDPVGATQPPGGGFYAVGSYFSSTVPGTIETDIQNGKKWVFSEWQLPDNTTRPNTNLGYTINQGGTVVAKYKTYYQLTLKSEYPPINETSWELAGSNATWHLALHAVPVESGFWRFLGVTQVPVNASGQQLMNGPATVEILWSPNYWPAIIAILIVLLVIAAIVYLIYRFGRKPAAKPAAKTRTKKSPAATKKRTAK